MIDEELIEYEALEIDEFDLRDLDPNILKALEPIFLKILRGMNEKQKAKYYQICKRTGRLPFWERKKS